MTNEELSSFRIATILKWMESEYSRKKRDFSFGFKTIVTQTGLSRYVVAKTVGKMCREGYPIKMIGARKSTYFKWKTTFGEYK